MTVKMVKVKLWFAVEQEFVMAEKIYEGMTEHDWLNSFRQSVLDGEVTDWEVTDVDEIEPEDDDARD